VPHDYSGDRAAEGRNRIDPALAAQIRVLEDEVTLLRRRLTESPRHVRLLEERLDEASASVAQLTERNAKLVETLREARSQLLALREEVDRLAQPPSGYGGFLGCSPPGAGCGWRYRLPWRSRTCAAGRACGSMRR
jgi:proteasome-associated ATPase